MDHVIRFVFKLQSFFWKLDLWFRRKVIQFMGYSPRKNYYLDNPIGYPKSGGIKRLKIYPSIKYVGDGDMKSATRFYPQRNMYCIDRAIVDRWTGAVYDANGDLVADCTAWPLYRFLFEVPRPKCNVPRRYMKGSYVFFNCSENYYHLLIESVPELVNLKNKLKNSFRIVEPIRRSSLSDELLSMVGVYNLKVNIGNKRFVGLSSLYLVSKSTPGFFGHTVAHPLDIRLLRKEFLGGTCGRPHHSSLLVYLSRVGFRRKLENEELLENYFNINGFCVKRFFSGIREQIDFFGKCKFLVGRSGAALTNMLWMPKGSTVVLLEEPPEKYHFFRELALFCGHNFHAVSLNVIKSMVGDERVLAEAECNRVVIDVLRLSEAVVDNIVL